MNAVRNGRTGCASRIERPVPSLAPAQIQGPSRGLAALTVVMVLLFVMALVAAYTNRNLIFEQRVATNGYRAERALIAADSGLDWAITLLNAGRINGNCEPSTNSNDTTFRSRYLARTGDGNYAERRGTGSEVLYPSCVLANKAFTCVCPTQADPDPVPHAVRDWSLASPGSAFRVAALYAPATSLSPGTVPIEVLGCGSPGSGSTSCSTNTPRVDGRSLVRSAVGLVRALPKIPPAALTAGGDVTATGATLRVSNPDGPTGMTVHAGGSYNGPTGDLRGPAGSANAAPFVNDAQLADLLEPASSDRFTDVDLLFRTTFGLPYSLYRTQPAVVRVTCPITGCTMADLDLALNRYPGLTLWFDGDLALSSPTTLAALGSSTDPVMLIVEGDLSITTSVDVTGFVFAESIQWQADAIWRGALMAEEHITIAPGFTATVIFDAEALRNIEQYYGSFVRAPGGWDKAQLQ